MLPIRLLENCKASVWRSPARDVAKVDLHIRERTSPMRGMSGVDLIPDLLNSGLNLGPERSILLDALASVQSGLDW